MLSVGTIFPYNVCMNSVILNILHVFDLYVFSLSKKIKRK